jgi:hypothetical protein
VRALNPELVKKLRRDTGVESQTIFLLGPLAPLAQAPADHVGAQHAVAWAQVFGQLIHVAPGARKPMPCDHHGRIGCTPLGVMNLQTGTGDIVGTWGHSAMLHHQECKLRARSLPTTPDGK